MEKHLRYVLVIFVLVVAIFWIRTEYIGADVTGTDSEAQKSTCVIKSDAGEAACSSLPAAVLSSLNDGDQDGMQRAARSDVASTSQSATSFEIGRGGTPMGDTQSDINIASSARPTETSEAETTYEQSQYIGEFIDVDDEFIDTDRGSTGFIEESLGVFIDVDADADLADVFYNEQSIGDFIEVEVDSGIIDSEGIGWQTIGVSIEIDSPSNTETSIGGREDIGPILIVDSI